MTRIAAAAALALFALPSLPAADDGPEPLAIDKGASAEICARVLCPVISFQCDDPSIVRVESSKKGPLALGVKAGTTLCAAVSANYQRKVFRVTVK